MSLAELNFTKVQQAAENVEKILVKIGGDRIFSRAELDLLIQDLRTTYTFIRRNIKDRHPQNPSLINQAEAVAKSSPTSFRADSLSRHPCLCPLTVFLQEVAKALTNLRSDIDIDYNQAKVNPKKAEEAARRGWGAIKPFRAILQELSKSLKPCEFTRTRTGGGTGQPIAVVFFPGMAQCLMFHEENSAYIVTSSAVRYENLLGLQKLGYQVRDRYIKSRRDRLSPTTEARIRQVEFGSTTLWEQAQNPPKGPDGRPAPWQNPFGPGGIQPATMTGQNGAFDPRGNYKNACLMDFCRFIIDKPLEAAKREERQAKKDNKKPNMKPNRPPFPENSCAEWEMWITILSTTEVSAGSTTRPRPVARKDGQQRSDTYPPTPQVASKRPSHSPLQFQAPAGHQNVTPPKPTKAPSRPAQWAYNQQYLSPQPPRPGNHSKPGTPSPRGYVRPEPMQMGQPKPRKKHSSRCC